MPYAAGSSNPDRLVATAGAKCWLRPISREALRRDAGQIDRHPNERQQGRMIVASWIALGSLIGLLAHRVLRVSFPGGTLGTIAAGATGAFLGGALARLLADRGIAGFDTTSLLVAALGAIVLLSAIRTADYTEPRPR
jgi:uncharacterized membrane protein YeaQ/YmgE (transglycosylase-associated protein family)